VGIATPAVAAPTGSMTDYTPLERGAPVPARTLPVQNSTLATQPQDQAQPVLGEHTAEIDPTGPPVAPLDPTRPTQTMPESDLPIPHAPSTHPAVPDPESFALVPPTLPNGRNIYEYDLAVMKSTGQPWRRAGSDLSKWFNYGFDEDSWTKYLGWRRGMTTGVEGIKGMKPGDGLPDDVADLMHLPRQVSGPEPARQDGGNDGGNNNSNNPGNNAGNQANNMGMMNMAMGMGMPEGMQMNMPDMFNQMNQMGMDPAAMMGMPMMQGMQGMPGMQGMQGMDFAQMAGMMNMFGAGGPQQQQPQQQQQQQQMQQQQQQMQMQMQGGQLQQPQQQPQGGQATPGQTGDAVKQEEGETKPEGTAQGQADGNVSVRSHRQD